ncbi:unnamed protein product [Linum tenue]|uniref:Uncharacterized protein n=1 Tax=Linum tenue TaxID=586396 RepID=A0AAV0JTB4_9ROSI|nr:unnamed protein product [Linum tenue]
MQAVELPHLRSQQQLHSPLHLSPPEQ